MRKIWIPIVIFAVIFGAGWLYNSFLTRQADEMLRLSDVAYEAHLSGESSKKYLKEIDNRLDKISGLLCAFLDREIINDASDAIACAIALDEAKSFDCGSGIVKMREKIRHIKNSAQIKLKYIL